MLPKPRLKSINNLSFNLTYYAPFPYGFHSHVVFQFDILPSLNNATSLQFFQITSNNLGGVLQESISNLSRILLLLAIDDNQIVGTIPAGIGNIKSLESLSILSNQLSGSIPKEIGNLQKLKRLYLGGNELTGNIPSSIGYLKDLIDIDLPDNKLRGSIPPSLGNCTNLLSLFKATNGFSSSNLIGVGSFGYVYKGTLEQDRVVAVKVFNLQRRGAFKSFITECEAMKNIRHRNLVKVITTCSSIDIHGNDFKALVYEFMVNGSLEDWLHPNSESNVCEVRRKLNLLQRLNVAIDVASALDYLHYQYSQTPIVHCDLKPSNILLDDEMTAQVGDFGLVKFLTEETYNTHIGQASSAGLRGTIGYAAPEYGMGSEVSTKGDVYIYGILLLEMFSGKRPTDDMFHGNMNLRDYVKKALPQYVINITEPMILFEGEEDESNASGQPNQKVIESLLLIFGIGIACSEETPTERMNTSDLLAKLLVIRDKLADNGGLGRRAQVPRMRIPEA